jgi:hypothetical protein
MLQGGDRDLEIAIEIVAAKLCSEAQSSFYLDLLSQGFEANL